MKKKVKRHRSTEIGNYIVKHYIVDDISGLNCSTNTNVIATSCRVNIHITSQHHSFSRPPMVAEKTDATDKTSNNQTTSKPKQTQTGSNQRNSNILTMVNSAAPYVVLAAATIVTFSLIKKRA